MANIPIKIYKDRVEIKNLKITETVEGISAETIGAADAAQVSELTEVVNKNYKNLDEKIANITNSVRKTYLAFTIKSVTFLIFTPPFVQFIANFKISTHHNISFCWITSKN